MTHHLPQPARSRAFTANRAPRRVSKQQPDAAAPKVPKKRKAPYVIAMAEPEVSDKPVTKIAAVP